MSVCQANLHQAKSKRQEDMTSNLISQRHNSRKILDGPSSRRSSAKVDHTTDNRNTEKIHPFKIPEDLIKTNAETLLFDFFGCGCPLHFDGEEVAEKSGGEVE